jgi:hypothetical protein
VSGSRVSRRFWRPPAETLEALGSVLGAHWRAAARRPVVRLFLSTGASWLPGTDLGQRPARVSIPRVSHHFTTGGRLIR